MGLAARFALLLCLFMLAGGCSLKGRPPAASPAGAPPAGLGQASLAGPARASQGAPLTRVGHESASLASPVLSGAVMKTVVVVPEGGFMLDDGTPATPAEVVRRLDEADYILVGEAHTSPCDHRMQARVLRMLVDAGIRPVVGLEMLPTTVKAALDEFSAGRLTVDALPDAVDWRTNWGYDFGLYRPVFDTIAEAGLPVRGLNLPYGLARKAGRMGLEGLTPDERAFIPPVVLPPSEAQRATLEEVFREHMTMREGRNPGKAAMPPAPEGGESGEAAMPPGADTGGQQAPPSAGASPARQVGAPGSSPSVSGTAPRDTGAMRGAFDSFMLVQSVWDAGMAYEAVRAKVSHGGPVVILAGTGHVEFGWGIARRLRGFDPAARIVLLLPWRGGEVPEPAQADMFFRCQAAPPRIGLGFSFDDGRVRIVDVLPGSPADRAGFRPGDIVETVAGRKVDAPKVLHEAGAAAVARGDDVTFTVLRGGERRSLTIPGVRAGSSNPNVR